MDPNAALKAILCAMLDGDVDATIEHCGDLNGWIGRGGFQPDYRQVCWDVVQLFLEEHDAPGERDDTMGDSPRVR
jgi:hypothetical protein